MAQRPETILRSSTGTLSDELRSRLEEMILDGTLAPGERLDEIELATRFGMSRTPVREALKALAANGLVEIRGRQGISVTVITIPVLLEMFQMMAVLEGLCARLAARRADAGEHYAFREIHSRLKAALENEDPVAFYAVNGEFHEALYDAAHTQFIADQTRALRRRIAPYRRYVTFQPGRMLSTIGEHERIIIAIERAEPDAAFMAASQHVNLLGDDVADLIAALPAGMMSTG